MSVELLEKCILTAFTLIGINRRVFFSNIRYSVGFSRILWIVA